MVLSGGYADNCSSEWGPEDPTGSSNTTTPLLAGKSPDCRHGWCGEDQYKDNIQGLSLGQDMPVCMLSNCSCKGLLCRDGPLDKVHGSFQRCSLAQSDVFQVLEDLRGFSDGGWTQAWECQAS
jgi:hypothetical protein